MVSFKTTVVEGDIAMCVSFGAPKRSSAQGSNMFKDLISTEVTTSPFGTSSTNVEFNIDPSIWCFELMILFDDNTLVADSLVVGI
jgi:hypothetical protein